VGGLIAIFDVEGTFDRFTFTRCCGTFVYSEANHVRQYPGPHSVWILDGASIHRDPEIVHYLRSIGVVPTFLPAYCPFFNPIEFMFGYVKRAFQRYYNESSDRDLLPFVVETFGRFKGLDMSRVFEHCGWMAQGHFNPVGPMSTEKQRVPDIWDTTPELYDGDDSLGFVSR
jgi:transposase